MTAPEQERQKRSSTVVAVARRTRLLELLLAGVPPSQAARELKCSVRTVGRHAAALRKELQLLERERLTALTHELGRAVRTAIETLERVAGDPTAPPGARAQAAASLLAAYLKFLETTDVAERLRAMEETLERLKGGTAP